MTNRSKRAGVTLIEMISAMFILLIVMASLVPMIHVTGVVWNKGSADAQAKDRLSVAAFRLGPTLRNALRVDVANSTAKKLVVILPKLDAAGSVMQPMADGDVITFYLSDTTGQQANTGSILWRAVNGKPDKDWSIRSGGGRLDFGTTNLNFALDTPADPSIVTMTAYTTVWTDHTKKTSSVSTSILLRNHQIAG